MPDPAAAALVVRPARFPEDWPAIAELRRQVFQVEQGVPAAIEFDGLDGGCEHWLARWDGEPAGTVRLRELEPGRWAKVERLAIARPFRRRGLGSALMAAACDRARERGFPRVKIHAQAYVRALYERLGFVVEGAPFEEAGIPHLRMVREL